MRSWRRLVRLVSILGVTGGMVFSPVVALSESQVHKSSVAAVAGSLIDLPNGIYQFCTAPAPQDWREGAGACLIATKTETTASGYYGYPHSESFICLNGEISQTNISGTGMAISWAGDAWTNVPGSSFYWDAEARLFLAEGDWVRQEESVGWIVFQQAQLDTQGLYQYESLRMTPPNPDHEHMLGNHVLLRCADADVLLAHFQQGSVTVQENDAIATGQLLGKVGNSGNSNEPHLHIHAQISGRKLDPLNADPLPP